MRACRELAMNDYTISVADDDNSRLDGHKQGMRREPAQLPMLCMLGRREKHCRHSLDKKVPVPGTRRMLRRLGWAQEALYAQFGQEGPSVGNEKGACTAANAASRELGPCCCRRQWEWVGQCKKCCKHVLVLLG
jgi:hypothetical protein